jgi:hypothetical protein
VRVGRGVWLVLRKVLKEFGGVEVSVLESIQKEEEVVDPSTHPCLHFEPQCENWVAVVTFHTQNTCGLPPVVGGATQHRVLEIQ